MSVSESIDRAVNEYLNESVNGKEMELIGEHQEWIGSWDWTREIECRMSERGWRIEVQSNLNQSKD